jgi:hypothetical protein
MKPTVARVLNNHLVVPTNNPGQLRAVFPTIKEATIKGIPVCAVPFTLDAARVLNNLGISAPSPIRHDYDWPGHFTPRWYQTNTAEFCTLNPRAHILNAPRTGKTLSVLWAADYLRRCGVINRVLIVAPLSTLDDVWTQNIFEHFPLRTFCTLHGSRQKRLDLLAKPHNFYVINHHGIGIIEEALEARPDIDLIIVDESAVFKNAKTPTLWKPLNKVINKQGVDRWAWGLTGTPTDVSPTDAFAQSKLITPANYKGHFTTFKNETMFQLSQFRWIPRNGWEKTVQKALAPSIRYDRSVCTDMEPCRIYRKAELSPEQDQHYKALLRQAVTEVRGSAITAVNAGALVQKLVQVACGVAYGVDGETIKMDFGPRLGVLKELIRENQEKVIVFVPFTGVLEALAEELRKDWSVAVVDGSVSKNQRDQIFKEFRSSKSPHIILAHPTCMAHGLDLTDASLAIWYAPHNKSTYNQACARIDGSRQTVKIDIAHIYATAAEKKTYEVIQEQGRMQDVLLDLVKDKK